MSESNLFDLANKHFADGEQLAVTFNDRRLVTGFITQADKHDTANSTTYTIILERNPCPLGAEKKVRLRATEIQKIEVK
jgi:hypothetical protein